jgi:uncharacterized protein YbaR (Trm112 family)
MISAELLKMLRCPDDRSPLAEADGGKIATLNAEVAAGRLRNRSGERVTQMLDGGLVRRDGKFLYPIVDGIPILLIDEAIPLVPPVANGQTGG